MKLTIYDCQLDFTLPSENILRTPVEGVDAEWTSETAIGQDLYVDKDSADNEFRFITSSHDNYIVLVNNPTLQYSASLCGVAQYEMDPNDSTPVSFDPDSFVVSISTTGTEVTSDDSVTKTYTFNVKNDFFTQQLASADFNFFKCSQFTIQTNTPVFKRDGVETADYYLEYKDRPKTASLEWDNFEFSDDLCPVDKY